MTATHTSSEGPASPAPREPFLEPIAWLVLAVGLVAAVLAFVLSAQSLSRREDTRLTETTDDLERQVDAIAADLQDAGAEVSAGIVATGNDPDDFEILMRRVIRDDPLVSGIAVISTEGGLQNVAESGTVRAVDFNPEDTSDVEQLADVEELAARLTAIEAGDLAIIGSALVNRFQIVDIAFDVPGANDLTVIAELSIPSALFDESAGDTDFAFYLSTEEDPERLLFASTDDLPLSGSEIRRTVAFGDLNALLVTSAPSGLLSTTEKATPWLIAGALLVLTITATPIVHAFARRRRQVRTLRAEKAELDEAFRQLRASEERFRSVLNSSPDVICRIDSDRTVQILNRPDFFGRHPESVNELLTMVHDEDRARSRDRLDRLFGAEPGTIVEFESRLEAESDDEIRWVRVRGGVGTLIGREEPYVLAIFTDITEPRKQAERHALLEAQLVQSQRLEAVGQLAGGVAHDFNNILAAILSGAELILDDVPDGETREDVLEIQSTARRGAELSRQLLMFSRGEPSSAPEVLDVGAVVREIERMLSRSIGEGIELETEIDADLKPIYADKAEIERIVMNLAINARDAMPDRGGHIVIRVRNLSAGPDYASSRVDLRPGDYIELEVADDGSGMEEEVVRRAFEPFFSTKERGKGTGLGLASVYGIVQNRQGHIEIDSTVGEGTTIRILLPVTHIADRPSHADTDLPSVEGEGEAILLIEDEDAVRNAVARLLERRGYEVTAVEDGDAAFRAVATTEFDLVLSDILLPAGTTGNEVVERLRRDQPEMSVVFMTGHSSEMLEGVGLDPEELVMIRKPFDEERLLRMVRAAIEGAAEQPPPPGDDGGAKADEPIGSVVESLQ